VLVSLVGGGTETYNNNGGGYPVDDAIIFQGPQSCLPPQTTDAEGDQTMTVVAAVRVPACSPRPIR
jgi:hypothetical protein